MEQKIIFSSKSPSKYEFRRPTEEFLEDLASPPSLIILSENIKYSNIIDVKAQVSKYPISEYIKNPIILKVMENIPLDLDNKYDKQIQFTNDDQRGTKIFNKWVDRRDVIKILSMFYKYKISRREISQQLLIPYSTVCRQIRNFNDSPQFISSLFNQKGVKLENWPKAQKEAMKYIRQQSSTFSSANISNYIESKLGIKLWRQSIIEFLKGRLKMKYRRVSARPICKDSRIVKLMQIIFWLEYSNILTPHMVVVNNDETLFSNDTKINYSWKIKNEPNNVSNISFRGSLSLIGAITNKGDWYYSNLIENNSSDVFIKYLEKLMQWVECDLGVDLSRVLLLMDNSPIHTSYKWSKYMNSLNWKIMFLSPYSPEYCPIELLFRTLKRRLSNHCKNQIIRLKKKEGYDNIIECLCTISREEILSFWKQTMRNISKTLDN